MKYIFILIGFIAWFPVYADDCLDAGVRFRSFGNTGGGEVYLGMPDLGVGSNRVERNLTWNNPEMSFHPFVFEYNRNGEISVMIDGELMTYDGINFTNINALLVTVADRDTNSDVRLTNLVVNGESFPDMGIEGTLVTEVFLIDEVPVSGVITGTIELMGEFSQSQELSRVEIRVGRDDCNLLPEPETEVRQTIAVPTMTIAGNFLIAAGIFLIAACAVSRKMF